MPLPAQEHLRRVQGRRRGPLRTVPPRPPIAGGRASNLSVLPRGRRRPSRRADRLVELEGERAAAPASRYRRCGRRLQAGGRQSAAGRLRPLHRERDHTVRRDRRRGASRRPGSGGAPPLPRRRGTLCRLGVAASGEHRPGVPERPRPQRSGLGAAVGFPPSPRSSRRRGRAPQPSRRRGRSQGIPRPAHRRLHDKGERLEGAASPGDVAVLRPPGRPGRPRHRQRRRLLDRPRRPYHLRGGCWRSRPGRRPSAGAPRRLSRSAPARGPSPPCSPGPA